MQFEWLFGRQWRDDKQEDWLRVGARRVPLLLVPNRRARRVIEVNRDKEPHAASSTVSVVAVAVQLGLGCLLAVLAAVLLTLWHLAFADGMRALLIMFGGHLDPPSSPRVS
jgi:hypothetical protein